MTAELIKKTLKAFRTEDERIKQELKRFQDSIGNTGKILALINQLYQENQNTNCICFENQSFCTTLIGIGYLDLCKYDEAVKWLESGSSQFSIKGESWNQAITLRLLGHCYLLLGKTYESMGCYEKAKRIIQLRIRIGENNYDNTYHTLLKELNNLIKKSQKASKPAQLQKKKPEQPSQKTSALKMNARLTLSWLPIYPGVQAGANGPILVRPQLKSSQTDITLVTLDNKNYLLHSIAKSKQQITLVDGLNYGWAKVFGDSMVAANIDENDYVLFYESADAEHHSIVVASLLEPNGADLKLIVKRYTKIDHLLCSETIPPNLYDPIELGGETKILGTVVAIAKLTDETQLDVT